MGRTDASNADFEASTWDLMEDDGLTSAERKAFAFNWSAGGYKALLAKQAREDRGGVDATPESTAQDGIAGVWGREAYLKRFGLEEKAAKGKTRTR
jgi:hypothetical protein